MAPPGNRKVCNKPRATADIVAILGLELVRTTSFRMGAMPAMPLTVVLAHVVYSAVLGHLTNRWVRQKGWLLAEKG